MLGGYQDLSFGFRDVDRDVRPVRERRSCPTKVAELQPDLVMVLTTVWDVLDRRLTPDGPELSPTDPELEAAMAQSLGEFTDGLLAQGVPRVVWVHEPVPLPTPTARRRSAGRARSGTTCCTA